MWLIGGAIGVSWVTGAVSPDYRVFESRGLHDPRYLQHLLRSSPYMDQYGLYVRANTTFDRRVQQVDLDNMPVLVPPLDTQRRIADFLDYQVSRMDEAVRLRGEQIEALEDRLRVIEFEALRGSVVDEPRHSTTLEWMSDLPQSWLVATVGSQFEVMLGKMLNEDRARGLHMKPYLRNTNVQWNRVDVDDLAEMDFPVSDYRRYSVQSGDLLICEGGQPGRAAIWDGRIEEMYYQKALHRARSRGRSNPRWLYYCLRVAVAQNVFASQGSQATIAHLTGEQLSAQRFPFPDPDVQASIVAELDETTTMTEAAVSEMTSQIALLEERKRSLISAAVTGEFDVTTASGRGI